MVRKENAVPCRDCGLSVWDPAGDGRIFFDCSAGCVPDKTMAVSTAERLLVTGCTFSMRRQRHGGGDGLTVFDIARGKRLERSRNEPEPQTCTELPMDPVSCQKRKERREQHRKEDQRTLEWCFEKGPKGAGAINE